MYTDPFSEKLSDKYTCIVISTKLNIINVSGKAISLRKKYEVEYLVLDIRIIN